MVLLANKHLGAEAEVQGQASYLQQHRIKGVDQVFNQRNNLIRYLFILTLLIIGLLLNHD